MEIGTELVTEKGTGTYLGNIGLFAVTVHLSPTPVENEPFNEEIEILLSDKENVTSFIGALPLNDLVSIAASNNTDATLTADDYKIKLSKEDCQNIDDLAWAVLNKKYRIAPAELVL